MQPWKISAGLTAAIAGSAVLLAGPRLEYLAPYWPPSTPSRAPPDSPTSAGASISPI